LRRGSGIEEKLEDSLRSCMSSAERNLYEFGAYRLDVAQRVFTREGRCVSLPPKSFELLLLFVQSPGRAFSKRELMTALWPDTFVEEANLSFQISVLRKAFERDAGLIETVPKHGYRFAADVRAITPAVQPAPTPLGEVSPSQEAQAVGLRARSKWAITAFGASVLLAGSYWIVFTRPPTTIPAAPAAVAVPLTAYPGFEIVPTLSPDGSQVAFAWDGLNEDNRDIYVKLVGPGQPHRLTTDPQGDSHPAWSPDGQLIAFHRSGAGGTTSVFVIPALGGAERLVVTLDSLGAQPQPRGNLAWTPDGKWIAVGGRPSRETTTGIWLVALEGAQRRPLTEVGGLDAGDTSPAFSPDGRYLAFIRARKSAVNAVYVVSLSSMWTPVGQPIRITAESWNIGGLAWSPHGMSLVFSSGGHQGSIRRLHRIAFTPTLSTQPVQPEVLPFGEQATAVTISRTGRLVYSAVTRDAALWRLPLTVSHGGLVPVPVASSTYDELTPDYSPDGKRLAFTSNRSGDEEIWIANADGSNPEQVTSMKGPLCANPRWSPDGSTILFNSRREGSADLYLLTPNTGEIRRITDDPAEEVEPRWSRDGRSIYFGSNRTGRFEVWKTSAVGGPAERITQHGGLTATESPDGRFLYYAKQGRSQTSIWQVPVGGGEEKLVVDGLSHSLNFVVADGGGLYFLAVAARPGVATHVIGGPRQTLSIDFFELATGKRTTLFVVGKQSWVGMALSPDQRSLLYSVLDRAGANLMLVEGFR
jgi:Tol biopolymer transport system component/DNA-binding winged helix-turn-helix (wHTH) protein